MIHPAALIDPKAQIDSDVVVGPYALIEGSVRISSGTEFQGHERGFVILGLHSHLRTRNLSDGSMGENQRGHLSRS